MSKQEFLHRLTSPSVPPTSVSSGIESLNVDLNVKLFRSRVRVYFRLMRRVMVREHVVWAIRMNFTICQDKGKLYNIVIH